MLLDVKHLTMEELEEGLYQIRQSPKDAGVLEMIVRRPQTDERELLKEAELDMVLGLVGDNWSTRGSRRTPDGSPHPEMQINAMNSRVTALLAQDRDRWALAGDQFYIDMDLSIENLPAGTQLAFGAAVIEVTPPPHLGCKKFESRFGMDAIKFVNSDLGKELRLRGINAKVVRGGVVRIGDVVTKIWPKEEE